VKTMRSETCRGTIKRATLRPCTYQSSRAEGRCLRTMHTVVHTLMHILDSTLATLLNTPTIKRPSSPRPCPNAFR
jgi:hypothetical protein